MALDDAHVLFSHQDEATLCASMHLHKLKPTGKLLFYPVCDQAKVKVKNIANTTNTVANTPAKRLFLDISGPYYATLLKYWVLIVDNFIHCV